MAVWCPTCAMLSECDEDKVFRPALPQPDPAVVARANGYAHMYLRYMPSYQSNGKPYHSAQIDPVVAGAMAKLRMICTGKLPLILLSLIEYAAAVVQLRYVLQSPALPEVYKQLPGIERDIEMFRDVLRNIPGPEALPDVYIALDKKVLQRLVTLK